MFRVRAEFREDALIEAGVERVRAFFSDLRNFARLMPGVESIREEGGVAFWTVAADVALIGRMRGEFAVVLRDDSPRRIEWGPAAFEKKNLLRYAIGFEELDPSRTLVRVAERVELRREHATHLHLMAPLVGAGRISEGVEEEVALMMRTFLNRARVELEERQ